MFMGLAIQYDLFEEQSEINDLRKQIMAVKASNDNVRKGLFAKQNELMKMLLVQQGEIEKLRMNRIQLR